MRRLSILIVLLCFNAAPLTLLGQGSDIFKDGLRVRLNDQDDAFVRFLLWNQIWARYLETNPGTQVNGTPVNSMFDIGIRRARLLMYAQVSPRYRIIFHAGINNQTFATGGVPNGGVTGNGGDFTSGKKPQVFVHDAWNEYDIVPEVKQPDGRIQPFSLTAGVGLHYWNSVSRMTNGSTVNFLAIDAPIFNWFTIEQSDQFARQFGLFLKGRVGRLDYRMHLNKPFATNAEPVASARPVAVDNNGAGKAAYGGYFMYQFMDLENNLMPYTVGTYLGTQRVFNIGAGIYSQQAGTRSAVVQSTDTIIQQHDIRVLGLDVFADLPFGGEKNMAVTAYSVLYLHDWGPRYFRTVGIMNPGAPDPEFTGQRSETGAGNARPMLGTGNIWYTQAGLLLPKWNNSKVRYQPFVAYTMQDLEALEEPMGSFDAGFNILLDGHHAKLTFQYRDRPMVVGGKSAGTLGEFILQAQVYL
ncbi:MAG: porin [Flavobacteriales bacterium]|nr:porin [Flavobacteriales bacterium]